MHSSLESVEPGRSSFMLGAHKADGGAGGDALTSPMQGTIVKIAVADGETVAARAISSSCSRT